MPLVHTPIFAETHANYVMQLIPVNMRNELLNAEAYVQETRFNDIFNCTHL